MKNFLWLIPILLLAALAGLYFWPEATQVSPEPPVAQAPAAQPAIRHPIESVDVRENPLPQLAESDGPLNEALVALLGHKLPQFVYMKNMIHRIVATVDNLPRDHVALRLMPVKPVPEVPITESSGENLVFSLQNGERYRNYMRLVDAVPVDAALALYARFYPLFQEQYESLGYPGKYFNDRVVEVIDHLLATPEIKEPLRLVQPRVLYEFADPSLEQLSAGQKILLRMGHDNQLKLKSKLLEIRQALVSMGPTSALRNHNPRS